MSTLLVKICNLRILVVIAAMWVITSSTLPHWLMRSPEQINQIFFRVGLYFSELPPPRTRITVIHIPDLEYERWLVDLPGASRLLQLLEHLGDTADNQGRKSVLGFVLEYPIALIQPEAESVLAEIQQGRTTNQHFYSEANAVLARRENLIEKLNSSRVVLGVENYRPSRYKSINVRLGQMQNYPDILVDWLWPIPLQSTESTASPVLNYFPIISNPYSSQSQPLTLRQQGNYIPSFWSQFIMASKVTSPEMDAYPDSSNAMTWVRDQGFSFGSHMLKTSPTGAVVPIYGRLSGIDASLRQISLSAALTRNDLSGWILIGRDGSEKLSQTAQILASLGDDGVMLEPYWWSPLKKLLFVLLTTFLLFFIPLLSHRRALWSVICLSAGLIALQLFGQTLHRYWLPSGTLLLFLLLGYAVMLAWLFNHRYQKQILTRADVSDTRLVSHLLETGVKDETILNESFDLLKNCQTSKPVLQKLYDIAVAFEESLEFKRAFVVFKELRRRRWRYRDVNTKLKRIKSVLLNSQYIDKDSTAEGKSTFTPQLMPAESLQISYNALDQTQALPNMKAAKTTFGRYEIERELGRGASGTVYLGFDPLISRQVAIKTLNYHQFSETEIMDVKSRFVREAEAAGSLSHPNIVPVFDVGEQGGAAYIAMDFAKGFPLSDFVTEEVLLPAFDVYRITLAVAEALEYAHENKIVHRDIKPGNVLYCSEPFQVKITDFGIARFIDNSQTRTGEILGSPLYMAPEQLLGKKVAFSADIFSLGVMFYQLLTGTLPFNGDSLASLTYDIVHTKHKGARTVKRSLPASATRITNVALQKKPGERYPSAAVMADALRKAIKRDFASEAKAIGF